MTMKDQLAKEEWRDIPDLLGRFQVSSHGRIKNVITGLVRALPKNKRGYRHFTYTTNKKLFTKSVHSAVADAFLTQKPDGLHINHIDGDRGNNAFWNLEYVTNRENSTHGKNGKSRVTGAIYCKRSNKWLSRLKIDGKLVELGRFNTQQEAGKKYVDYLAQMGMENRYAKK